MSCWPNRDSSLRQLELGAVEAPFACDAWDGITDMTMQRVPPASALKYRSNEKSSAP